MNEKTLDEIKANLTPKGRDFFKKCVGMMDELMDGTTTDDFGFADILAFSMFYAAFMALGEVEK